MRLPGAKEAKMACRLWCENEVERTGRNGLEGIDDLRPFRGHGTDALTGSDQLGDSAICIGGPDDIGYAEPSLARDTVGLDRVGAGVDDGEFARCAKRDDFGWIIHGGFWI